MKFSRQTIENLIDTNLSTYSILHKQYNNLETRYNQLENEYRETVRRIQESNLVPLETFEEVNSAYSQATILLSQAQEELNYLDTVRQENETLKTKVHDLEHSYKVASEETSKEFANNQSLHKLLAAAKNDVSDAEDSALFWENKYNDLHSRIKPAASLYKPLTGQTFYDQMLEDTSDPT